MNFFKFLSLNWEILNSQNDAYHINIDTYVDYHINYTLFCPIFLVDLKLHFHFFQISFFSRFSFPLQTQSKTESSCRKLEQTTVSRKFVTKHQIYYLNL